MTIGFGLVMAKRKSKNIGKNIGNQFGNTRAPDDRAETTLAARFERGSIEIEFFAREADLYRVGPVESFEDLETD